MMTQMIIKIQNIFIKESFYQDIKCSDDNEFSRYSRCLVRDDINEVMQIIFICFCGLFMILTLKCIYNLRMIFKLSKISKCANMKALNIVMGVFLILSIIFYSDGLFQLINLDDFFPLYIYQTLNTTSILVLNSAMSLGSYYWIAAVSKATFNNSKSKKLKFVCKFLMILNICLFIVVITDTIIYPIQDNTLLTISHTSILIIRLVLFIASSTNGIFFSLGCYFLWRSIRNQNQISHTGNLKVESLVICAAIFSLLRAIQDLGNLYGWVMNLFFTKSIENDTAPYAIYYTLYIFLTSVVPAFLILIKFSPSNNYDNEKLYVPSFLTEEITNNDAAEYLHRISLDYARMKKDGKKHGVSMLI